MVKILLHKFLKQNFERYFLVSDKAVWVFLYTKKKYGILTSELLSCRLFFTPKSQEFQIEIEETGHIEKIALIHITKFSLVTIEEMYRDC